MRVAGSFLAAGNASLQALPEILDVGGHLRLHGCINLTRAPQWLRVAWRCRHGPLHWPHGTTRRHADRRLRSILTGCAKPAPHSPHGSSWAGLLNISQCWSIPRVPETVQVAETLIRGRMSYVNVRDMNTAYQRAGPWVASWPVGEFSSPSRTRLREGSSCGLIENENNEKEGGRALAREPARQEEAACFPFSASVGGSPGKWALAGRGAAIRAARPMSSMTVNGKAVTADVDPRTLLVQFLRENLRLTGTHVGCDTSQCGACVVHLDGRAVKSCTMLAASSEGAKVTTIEGLAKDGELHRCRRRSASITACSAASARRA